MKHKDRNLQRTEDLYVNVCEQIQKLAMVTIKFANTCDKNSMWLRLKIKNK